MKRALVIAGLVAWVVALVLLRSVIKDFLWTHPWWHSFLVAVPTILLPILAYLELRHSAEANTLRAKANGLRDEANALQSRIADLTAELDAERNKHLQRIAANTKRQITQAERNAEILRKHLKAKVAVSEGKMNWGETPEIVEVSDDNIVTLFAARGHSSSQAW